MWQTFETNQRRLSSKDAGEIMLLLQSGVSVDTSAALSASAALNLPRAAIGADASQETPRQRLDDFMADSGVSHSKSSGGGTRYEWQNYLGYMYFPPSDKSANIKKSVKERATRNVKTKKTAVVSKVVCDGTSYE